MLSEDDLREFYEEQLREQQEKLRRATKEKAKLFEEQIDLLQKLIRNQNKLWGIECLRCGDRAINYACDGLCVRRCRR